MLISRWSIFDIQPWAQTHTSPLRLTQFKNWRKCCQTNSICLVSWLLRGSSTSSAEVNQLSAPLKSWFLWIFLYSNVIEPHQSCTHHMVSQPVLSWHSYDGRPTTEIHPRSYLAASNSCIELNKKEWGILPTADMSKVPPNTAPKVSSERRWVHW